MRALCISGVVVLLWCTAVLAGSQPAAAQGRSLRAERIDVDLTVTTTGSLLVRERIRYRFSGPWNGVFRAIPTRYEGPGGFDYRLDLDLRGVSIEGRSEAPRVETRRSKGEVRWQVWVPDAENTVRTVVFEYRVRNALRFFEGHDELYWNLIGDDSEIEFGEAAARVVLPAGVTGLRSAAWVGGYGERDASVRIDTTPEFIEFESEDDLGWRRGMTLVVGWNPGVVARPTAVDRLAGFLGANIWLLLPFLSWGWMHRVWRRRGRDPEARSVTPRYQPPADLSPAEGGTLLDHHPHVHDITATIVDLAIRGYLRIEESESEGVFDRLTGGRDYTFHRLPDPAADTLKDHERRTLDALFAGGATTATTDALKYEFFRELPGIHTAIFAELVERRLYPRRPDKVRSRWVGSGVLLGTVAMGLLLLLAQRGVLGSVTAAVAGIGTGIPVLVYAFWMPARTRAGARVVEQIQGLEEFMARVEQDRFRRMIKTPEQFEELLPWAMALRVEERWASAFDDLFTEPPEWFVGHYPGGRFRAVHLAASLNSWSSRTGSAMTAAPRSSSTSSGFGGGGGGFSGGGFGGGSTGGF
ncbi:MAG: DUF2207 domain-containing protein [Longimicrobiales bacterium]|nr:DUF2207 domain-containing protein [Longimicrobiales bacterium]